jgi:hypothetical protein
MRIWVLRKRGELRVLKAKEHEKRSSSDVKALFGSIEWFVARRSC